MIYFIADAHLGSRIVSNPRKHEMRLVNWLDKVKLDAEKIFMLGDMFDFWFEYKTVVPKGYVRFLGKLAELTDNGIEIHFFTGNHDIWTFGYLENEIGLKVHRKPETFNLKGKKFYMAHGDGLFTDEKGFGIIRKIFHSPTCQKLFRLIPPQIGQNFGYSWSESNRRKIMHLDNRFQGENKEPLVGFAKKYVENHDIDFMIFGHRHIELDLELKNKSRVIILGDFVQLFSYGVFDGENFRLETNGNIEE
ncbi:MAG: UDP-2,3-diacylglucosamine diphosphatase [Bacteroidales bacterium]|nr:UDP-2,3-diacylglucosamine diphosphatase [Bacteroidales bacterium]